MSDNTKRKLWALKALDAFVAETFDTPSWRGMHPDDRRDAIGDLIGNLGHVCAAYGVDYPAVVQTGVAHFTHESHPDYQGD